MEISLFYSFISSLAQQPLSESWADGLSALKDALKLEAHVTRKIRDIASTCEDPGRDGQDYNDYHVIIT